MVKTTVKDNGFEGSLLPGDGRKNKVVIGWMLMFVCGIKHIKSIAKS